MLLLFQVIPIKRRDSAENAAFGHQRIVNSGPRRHHCHKQPHQRHDWKGRSVQRTLHPRSLFHRRSVVSLLSLLTQFITRLISPSVVFLLPLGTLFSRSGSRLPF